MRAIRGPKVEFSEYPTFETVAFWTFHRGVNFLSPDAAFNV